MAASMSALWFLMAMLAIIDAVWLHIMDMSVAPKVLLAPCVVVPVLLFLAFFYTRIRRDPRLASLAHMTAVFLTFTLLAAILSYLVFTIKNRPLIDPWLAATDDRLGFNFSIIYGWVAHRPILHVALAIVYFSPVAQIALLLIVLNFRGEFERSRELIWLIAMSALGCILVSAIWPSAGTFDYFHIPGYVPHLHDFKGLRDGSLKIMGVTPMQGLITFPSFHLALAVLSGYSARGIPRLFPVIVVLNALVIIATPIVGGHYLTDLLGGMVITLAAIVITEISHFRFRQMAMRSRRILKRVEQ